MTEAESDDADGILEAISLVLDIQALATSGNTIATKQMRVLLTLVDALRENHILSTEQMDEIMPIVKATLDEMDRVGALVDEKLDRLGKVIERGGLK